MGYPPTGTAARPVRRPAPPSAAAPIPRRAGPTRPGAIRPGATRTSAARPGATRTGAARPAGGRPPGDPGPRRIPLRMTVALVLTVGTLVWLALADENESSGAPGGDCATVAATVADLSPVQTRNARTITAVARERGLDRSAAEIAVATSLAETGLVNFANDGTSDLSAAETGRPLSALEREVARRSLAYPHDEVGNNLDSIGLFQQRPTTGWGAPDKLIVPREASGLFYDHLDRIPNWSAGVPWQVAQQVQSSPSRDGGIYEQSYARAVVVVGALWAEPLCPAA